MSAMVDMDTAQVIRACQEYLWRREQRILRERQAYVESMIKPRKWLMGLITLPGKSQAEAEHMWENDRSNLITPQHKAECQGLIYYKSTVSLLTLAHNTQARTMKVSTEYAYLFE